MAFIDSTSTQRVELLRQAEKTANLTRRVTVGSGVLAAPEGAEGAILCTALSDALAASGYGGLPPGGAMVNGGEAKPVMALGGTPLVTGSTLVEDGVFEGIEIPETAAVVQNTNLIQVREFNNTSIVSSSCPATVTANGVSYVSLPTAIAAVAGGAAVPGGVVNSASGDSHPATFTVAAGKVTNVKITAATTGMVDQGDAVSVQNSAGANGIGGTAQVAAGVVSAVRLPATSAALSNGASVNLLSNVGFNHGTVTVGIANGVVSGVTAPATIFPLENGYVLSGVAPTGTYTSAITFTVAGGVITAVTLS